jgi:capsule polysaccharide export protein KpsE/RkpR
MADNQASGSHQVLVDNVEIETGYVDLAERRAAHERTVNRLQLLWANRRLLLKLLLYGLAASLLIAFLIPARYESTARLMPPDQQPKSQLAMLATLAGKVGGDNTDGLASIAQGVVGVKTTGDLFIGVLKSRTIQDGLISKFDLRKVYRVRSWADAREELEDRTDISSDRKSGIITIKVTDRTPQRAAAMGREYISELNWVMTQLNTSSAHRERVFLEDRLQQVKGDLEQAEKDFGEFASKNATLDIRDEGKGMVEAAGSIEGELIASETQLQGLKQIYTAENVRVRSVQARIDELRRQLRSMGGKAGTSASTESSDDASVYPSIRELPLLGVSYSDLLRHTKIEEAVFATLTQEYEQAKVNEAKELPSEAVLDPPDVPEKKSFPHRALITVLGGLGVLAAGIAVVLGQSRWQETDPHSPGKAFAREVVRDVRKHLTWISRNGSTSSGPAVELPRSREEPKNQDTSDSGEA